MKVEWSEYEGAEIVPGKVSGATLFKDTRLPIETVVGNVDSFMEIEGLSLEDAIAETLACFPSIPGGAEGIRAVLKYREAYEHQFQL